MSALLLVSILASGFIFSSLHYPTSYRLNRTTGWLPYFIIATNGLIISLISLVILLYVDTQNYGRELASYLVLYKKDILQWGLSYDQLKAVSLAGVSVLFATLLGLAFKFFYAVGDKRHNLLRRLAKKDHFEKVIIDNITENKSSMSCVSITLRSRKVYIGWFEDVSFEQGELSDFTVTPILSGYRDSENLELIITVNYLEHFEADRRFGNFPEEVFKDYKITIMKDQVDFINLFSATTYKKFQKKKQEKIPFYVNTHSTHGT